ncbi:unnamed protein product, partial [Rotaria sordida]
MTKTSLTNDEYENISQILIKHVETNVPMSKTRISRTTIGTTDLETCFFFLLDFCLNNEPCCYGYHYSFPFDEKGLSKRKILLKILSIIYRTLKIHLGISSILPEGPDENKVSNFRLLIGGDDKKEGYQTRES